jgi:hypothetical protein
LITTLITTLRNRLKWLQVLLLSIALSGCNTAFLTFPGKTLKGEEISTGSFAFAAEFKLLQLEVRPSDPYSVWLRVIVINEHLYIDAADSRRWHKYLEDNPNVRIKLGNKIYLATTTIVTDQDLLDEFLQGRTIYQLDPR